MIEGMEVKLGVFYDVVGVAVGEDHVSILDNRKTERLIPVKPKFNRRKTDFEPIQVSGEFGNFNEVKGGFTLQGIEPRDITDIEVFVDFEEDDFHTRCLRLKSAAGLTLTWELFCEGAAA